MEKFGRDFNVLIDYLKGRGYEVSYCSVNNEWKPAQWQIFINKKAEPDEWALIRHHWRSLDEKNRCENNIFWRDLSND